MGRRNEFTPPSISLLPGPRDPALTVRELEVRARVLPFPPPGPGAPPCTLQKEDWGLEHTGGARSTAQTQPAHVRALTLWSRMCPSLPGRPASPFL